MKTMLLVVLLSAVGVLLPAKEVSSSKVYHARLITVHIEGWNLYADSQTSDGAILSIQIVQISTGEVLRTQNCSGYSCSISIADLPAGAYVAVVTCKYNTLSQQFKIS